MSTRANIVIEDHHTKLWFYRHSDGYPKVTCKSLKHFLRWLIKGKIRDNVTQCAGWLILLGAIENQTLPNDVSLNDLTPSNWACGAYEPTDAMHGDIQYLYRIKLIEKEINCYYFDDKFAFPFAVIDASNIHQEVNQPT